MSSKVLIVSGEPPWPVVHGGRVRTAGIASALASAGYDVRLACPIRSEKLVGVPERIEIVPLNWRRPSWLAGRLTIIPRLGVYASSGTVLSLQKAIDCFAPDFIYWSHSYLRAAMRIETTDSVKHIVEFANIEQDRLRSFAAKGRWVNRILAGLESCKAVVWERKVAREADLSIALSREDAEKLRSWCSSVITVENSLPHSFAHHSPDGHIVLSVANWEYGPNRQGLEHFLNVDWPLVIDALPTARLQLVGRGSHELAAQTESPQNVVGLGFRDDLRPLFQEAGLFLAPARAGGGRQLKVAEALGHGRLVVGPPYLAAENQAGMPEGAISASDDLASLIVDLLKNASYRHSLELEISKYAERRTWAAEIEPLKRWMRGHTAR